MWNLQKASGRFHIRGQDATSARVFYQQPLPMHPASGLQSFSILPFEQRSSLQLQPGGIGGGIDGGGGTGASDATE